MRQVWFLIYNILIVPLMWVAFYLMSLWNSKVRIGIRGRKHLFEKLSDKLANFDADSPRFWIHNSSMGEFEQSRPLIQALKSRFPKSVIIVTFFSPSGLENVKEDHGADILSYMPFDSFIHARRFIRVVRPKAAIVIRHEFWPNHLCRLKHEGIPSILINASIRHEKMFRYPFVVSSQRFIFGCFDGILSVSKETIDIIRKYCLNNALVDLVGDTRYDQVVQRAKDAGPIVAPLRTLKDRRFCFVAGSTWPADDAVILPVLSRLKKENILPWTILVPHEPTESHLTQIESSLMNQKLTFCRFSKLETNHPASSDVLLVDRVGILASLYALGDIAYVGGGFGAGVHQVLEPAAFGMAVFYGPKSTHSYEAGQLAKRGVGFVINHPDTLYERLSSFLKNPAEMESVGKKAAEIVNINVGASQRIVKCLEHIFSS